MTYGRTAFSRASTRSRRTDGAGLSVGSVFASRSTWSRWSLQRKELSVEGRRLLTR